MRTMGPPLPCSAHGDGRGYPAGHTQRHRHGWSEREMARTNSRIGVVAYQQPASWKTYSERRMFTGVPGILQLLQTCDISSSRS